jgi:hypothetical protein
MRAAIFASLIPAPDSDEERERLEDLIATIVDWDQVKDGNSAPPIRLNPPNPAIPVMEFVVTTLVVLAA